ncbi:MAG: adenylate/guanylate cyclase domain-containing protein [Pseudomonadota bacterium]
MNNSRKLFLWLGTMIVASGVGAIYGVLVGGTPVIGATAGLLVAGLVMGLEIFFIQSASGAVIRRLPLAALLVVSSGLWVVLIFIGLQLAPRIHGLEPYGDNYTETTLTQDMLFALAVSFVINAVLRVRTLVGPRVLSNFLLGRYYTPLREQRIFMFLDMADSTRLAETMGDLKVQSLIRRFFQDVAGPVIDYGGETHRYIGDEVVVTWPLRGDARDRNCIDCVLAIRAVLRRRAKHYEKRFGVVPEFRVGMHGGDVVASEIGEDKREIVYFGDTINTTARLAAACKTVGQDFLVSRELADRIGLPDSVATLHLEPLALTGKEELFPVLGLGERAA